MKDLDYIVNHYLAIVGIISPIFTCDETKEKMWKCIAEDFEALEKSFLDVMKDTRRTIPELECPRMVRKTKEEFVILNIFLLIKTNFQNLPHTFQPLFYTFLKLF